jgi:HdeA/HdeB family
VGDVQEAQASYADKDGYIDVQTLTCAQLAGTYQEDANLLTTWYSGWYNGLAKKHFINIARSKEAEHEVIVFCKAHLDEKIIKAIDIVFKDMRKRNGIELSK